jgi:EmrB/QacA subfamily drug resistance transporter
VTAVLGRSAGRGRGRGGDRADLGRHRLALWTLSTVQLLFLLDATIVNVALPHIQASLGFSGSGLEWVVTSYSIAFGGLLLLGGRAGDLLGLRRTFVLGLSVFTTASLLAGLAPGPGWLLAFRALQGLGAAAASPAALSLIAATFPEGPVRTRALGVYTVIGSIGGPLGLVVGGVVVTYLSWRWVMLINVPICVGVLALTPRAVRETPARRGRFDLPGAFTGTAGVALLVYSFICAATDAHGVPHWRDPAVLAAFTGAVVLLATFVLVEWRTARPLVPLRYFADKRRTGTLVTLMLVSTAMFGVYFFMTLYLQRVWHYSALRAAFVYVPMSLYLMAGARISSKIVGRTGPRRLVLLGLSLAAVGLAWLSRIDHDGTYVTGLMLPTLVTYGGFGLVTVPLTMGAIARVDPSESGLAAGLYSTARQIGGATGLAVLGTVAWSGAAGAVSVERALAVGAGRGFLVAAGVTALALIVAAASVRTPRAADERTAGEGGPAEEHEIPAATQPREQ